MLVPASLATAAKVVLPQVPGGVRQMGQIVVVECPCVDGGDKGRRAVVFDSVGVPSHACCVGGRPAHCTHNFSADASHFLLLDLLDVP